MGIDVDDELTQQQCELRADAIGVHTTAASAATIDHVAPNVALQGALLGMKTHEMADRAITMARGGVPPPTSASHPPFAARAQFLIEVYRQNYEDEGDARSDIAGMMVAADTAEELWCRAEPVIAEQLATGPSSPSDVDQMRPDETK